MTLRVKYSVMEEEEHTDLNLVVNWPGVTALTIEFRIMNKFRVYLNEQDIAFTNVSHITRRGLIIEYKSAAHRTLTELKISGFSPERRLVTEVV